MLEILRSIIDFTQDLWSLFFSAPVDPAVNILNDDILNDDVHKKLLSSNIEVRNLSETNTPPTERFLQKTKHMNPEWNIIVAESFENGKINVDIHKPLDYRQYTYYIDETNTPMMLTPFDFKDQDNLESIKIIHKKIKEETKNYCRVLKTYTEVIEPRLLKLYEEGLAYQRKKYIYLSVFKHVMCASLFFLSFYFMQQYIFLSNLSNKFYYYDEEMSSLALSELYKYAQGSEGYEIWTAYIKESSIIKNIDYSLLIEQDVFKPLIFSINNVKDFLMDAGDYSNADLAAKHLTFVIKFKKHCDKR